MSGPDPAVAAIRLAVRGVVAGPRIDATGPVLVACSGGADSLALLAATVFECRKVPIRVIGVVVDHGLQEGSVDHTARVVEQMAVLGVDETASVRVTVDPGPAGIEAGAREARYVALGQLAEHFSANHVLLGHTLDDQAETVLLGLARGSGGRSLQGMRRGFLEDGRLFLRPLLDITRAQTEQACRAENVEWWDDPHNADPRFVRSRVRHTVMPALERELGPGIAAALARTGEQLRADMEAIDHLVAERYDDVVHGDVVDLDDLSEVPEAIATRIVRDAAIAAGAPASELTYEHVIGLFALRNGKHAQLPGQVTATYDRGDGTLRFRPTT